jgi:hypothetical protein
MVHHGPNCLEGPRRRSRGWQAPSSVPFPNPDSDAPIRRELVDSVRRAIATGDYETPEKLEIALEKMLAQITQ